MIPQGNLLSSTPAAILLYGAVALSANSRAQDASWQAPMEAAGPETLKQRIQSLGRPEDSENWHKVFQRRLASVSDLVDGWDGPQSVAVSKQSIYRADRILTLIFNGVEHAAPPAVLPAGDGGIEFAWYLSDIRLQFEIDPDGTEAAWVKDFRTGREEDGEGSDALQILFRWAPHLTADKFQAA